MNVANIADLRQLAWQRLPRALFDYIDGGAQDEVTLRAKSSELQRHGAPPSVCHDPAHDCHHLPGLRCKA